MSDYAHLHPKTAELLQAAENWAAWKKKPHLHKEQSAALARLLRAARESASLTIEEIKEREAVQTLAVIDGGKS